MTERTSLNKTKINTKTINTDIAITCCLTSLRLETCTLLGLFFYVDTLIESLGRDNYAYSYEYVMTS